MIKRPRSDATELDRAAGPVTYEQHEQHSGMQGGQGNFAPQGTGDGFPCVKLRGLPFDVTEADVKTFLALSQEPIDIVMLKRDGRFSGEAIVLLSSPGLVEAAQAKHKMYLGSRFVEVFNARKMDYYRAVSTEYALQGGGPGGYSRRYDSGMGGGMGGGYGGGMGGGMGAGMGAGMGGAMGGGMDHGYNSMMPQGSYGSGAYSSGAGYSAGGYGQAGYTGGGVGGYGMSGTVSTNWIKLRGLPFSVIVEDVIDFFSDPSLGFGRIDPARVHLWNENGRATGMALVEFATTQEATVALGKNKAMMGTRYIEVFPATRGDLDKFMSRTGEQII